ncbi:GNAT family N-acetyltransferase [Luteimonas sp. A277]
MSSLSSNVLAESPLESRRFGLRVARGVLSGNETSDAVLTDINILRPDLAIFRCAAGDGGQLASLAAAGLPPLHADTLVYYRASLGRIRELKIESSHEVRAAESADGHTLATIIRQSFSDYRNHYHANPRLSREAILEGYVEWALGHATHMADAKQTWVYCVEGEPRSFATCRTIRGGEIEIILNSTAPKWSGYGLYSQLLSFLLNHYGQAGYSRLVISTQIWNYGVQRIWTRAGMVIDRAYDTFHVNVPHRFWDTAP